MRATAAAVRGAEGPEAVAAAGRATLLAEVGWNGATEAQREVAERFVPGRPRGRPPAAAGEAADPPRRSSPSRPGTPDARGVPFLALMEREVVELPLVEV